MKTAGYILLGLLALVLLWATLFGISFLGIHTSGFLNSQRMNVQTQVYENNIAYQRGQRTEFENLKLQWETTQHPAVCDALKSKFRADTTGLTQNQRDYITRLRCN